MADLSLSMQVKYNIPKRHELLFRAIEQILRNFQMLDIVHAQVEFVHVIVV